MNMSFTFIIAYPAYSYTPGLLWCMIRRHCFHISFSLWYFLFSYVTGCAQHSLGVCWYLTHCCPIYYGKCQQSLLPFVELAFFLASVLFNRSCASILIFSFNFQCIPLRTLWSVHNCHVTQYSGHTCSSFL